MFLCITYSNTATYLAKFIPIPSYLLLKNMLYFNGKLDQNGFKEKKVNLSLRNRLAWRN